MNNPEVELLKLKDPQRYKAMAMVSLIPDVPDTQMLEFVDELTKYMTSQSDVVEDTGEVNLKYIIPKSSSDLDDKSISLYNDIVNSEDTPSKVTSRLKTMILTNLKLLKSEGASWISSKKDRHLERLIGYYDQLMILKDISELADTSLKAE